MKRLLAILLLTLYISFNTGFIVHFHFCGEVFHHLTVLVEPENCCGNDCLCCHNSSYELTVDDDYDSEKLFSFIEIRIPSVVQESSGFVLATPHASCQTVAVIDTGPLIHIGQLPIYLTNRVFLI